MNTLVNFIAWIEGRILAFLGLETYTDPKVLVNATPKSNDREIIPFARTGVPHLGKDHHELVKKAEALYDDDDLRYKWLMSIHRLRATTSVGWILDKSNNNRKSPKWGLTHAAL